MNESKCWAGSLQVGKGQVDVDYSTKIILKQGLQLADDEAVIAL